jgi:hypothetical protein
MEARRCNSNDTAVSKGIRSVNTDGRFHQHLKATAGDPTRSDVRLRTVAAIAALFRSRDLVTSLFGDTAEG